MSNRNLHNYRTVRKIDHIMGYNGSLTCKYRFFDNDGHITYCIVSMHTIYARHKWLTWLPLFEYKEERILIEFTQNPLGFNGVFKALLAVKDNSMYKTIDSYIKKLKNADESEVQGE